MEGRICFFNSARIWGGGEKWHLEAAGVLHRNGHNVLLVANGQGQLYKRAVAQGIPAVALDVRNLSFLNPFKLLKTRSLFRRHHVDVVVMNLPADLKLAGVAAKWAGVEKIIYRRGSAIPIRSTRLNRWLLGTVVTAIIANSNETRNTILQRDPRITNPGKIRVIYNGIDVKHYDGLPSDPLYERRPGEIVIGNAGRLSFQKGQDLLLQAAALLERQGLDFKLLVAGEGRLRQELEQQAVRLGITHRVAFLGFVENIKAFMESLDIFALPSRWEGFGYALAEAMASAKPIVAFEVSSNPELVEDGVTGTLVPRDDVAGMARAILELARAPELRRAFGSAGRQRVAQKFDFETNLRQVSALLHEHGI